MSSLWSYCERMADLTVCICDLEGRLEWVWSAVACGTVAVRSAQSKGLGAFADRPFARGEVLFAEPPLVLWVQDVLASKPENLRRLEGLRCSSIRS